MDGRLAGILIGRRAADEFEILNLAVGREFRRRGVATQLVRAALEFAEAAGARQTYLEVRAFNEGGIEFYTRLGFQKCGRRTNYYRDPVEDAVLLVFHIGAPRQ
jgi:ribosomal-protein-alanine N-acetyltransferase